MFLMSAVLNEGLEELGECPGDVNSTFCKTRLKRVVLPSTLKTIGDYTFYWCR